MSECIPIIKARNYEQTSNLQISANQISFNLFFQVSGLSKSNVKPIQRQANELPIQFDKSLANLISQLPNQFHNSSKLSFLFKSHLIHSQDKMPIMPNVRDAN